MNDQKKRLPYLKVFGDWLTRFQKLDDAQFGRLVRAAIGYVCAGEEPAIDGMEGLSFDYIRPALDMDIIRYREKVEKNTENGVKGAAARWGIDSERHTTDSERHTTDSENSQERRNKIEDSKKKEPKKEDVKKEDSKEGESIKEAYQTAWRDFNAMRARIGQPVTAVDMKGIMKRLEQFAGDDKEKQARMLNMATENEWLNVFPLSEDEQASDMPSVGSIVSRIASGFTL